jgi:hypothetical protein
MMMWWWSAKRQTARGVAMAEQLRRPGRHGHQYAQMNGIEATAHITRTYPEIQVIGLSVNASGNNVRPC